MSEEIEALKSLHTALVDSRNGYEEALQDAEGRGLTLLFHEMIELRNRHHAELDRHLRAAGQEPDEKGSFVSAIHRAVSKVRSVLTGADESVLPGLIAGEQRIIGYYDEALQTRLPADAIFTLSAQRSDVVTQVYKMKARVEPTR